MEMDFKHHVAPQYVVFVVLFDKNSGWKNFRHIYGVKGVMPKVFSLLYLTVFS